MKKIVLIIFALIYALIAVSQPATLIEYPYVVKHLSNKDQIFTASVGKYFVGYSPVSQGDSVLYYSTSGTPSGLGTYSSPLPIDSISTLKSNGKKVLARIKRGDTYGTITIADSNIVVCSYSTVNTTAKPTINYIDYFGKANVAINNITQTYNGYRFVSNSGNDTYPGTKPDSAWATIAKVNASTFTAGDNILFKGGDVWREQLTARSGSAGLPIVYGAYGTGDNPVIEGADEMVLQGVPKNAVSLDKIFNTNTGNQSWYNYRIVYTSAQLKAAFNKNGTKFRLRVEGYVERVTKIGGMSIGESNGTTDDFTTAPTRLTFGGSNTVDIPAGGTGSGTYCDWINYPIDTLKNYTVHLYINGSVPAAKYLDDGQATVFRTTSTSDQTLTQTVTFESSSAAWRFINKFEIANGAVENLWMKEAIATKPWITWYNDTIAPLRTDTASLDVNGEWFWDSGASTYYMYSSVNPNGITDVGQRGILVEASSRNYVTLSNLTIQHSNNDTTNSARGAIYMYKGSNLTIESCNILDNARHGIFVLNSSNIIVNNCTLLRNGRPSYKGLNCAITSIAEAENGNFQEVKRYFTFTNNISSYSGRDGVMINSTTFNYPMKHITVSGNTFDNNVATGLYLVNSDSSVVANNYITNSGTETVGAPGMEDEDYSIGIQSGNNIDIYNNTMINTLYNDALQVWGGTTAPAHNVRIFNNYISGVADGDGIGVTQQNNNSMQNMQIYYNVIANVEKQHGLVLSDENTATVCYSANVFNNTFYNCAKNSVFKYTNFPVVLKNNIFYNIVNDSTEYGVFSQGTNLTSSNNLWYTTAGTVLRYNVNTDYTTATIATFEPSAQNTSPLFVNAGAGNFTLQAGSPAINNGVNVGLTTDILGNPIVGLPDIGANEYTPPVVP